MKDVQTKDTWTPERVKHLISLYRDGNSASEIAMRLRHGVTRNAVIGKLNRLGLKRLEKRQSRVPEKAPTRTKRRQAVQYRPTVLALPPAISEPSTAHAVTIMGLRDSNMITQCRWPLGEPSADMLYCGAPIEQGSYCAHHNRMAWKDAPPKLKYAWVG